MLCLVVIVIVTRLNNLQKMFFLIKKLKVNFFPYEQQKLNKLLAQVKLSLFKRKLKLKFE